MVAATEGDVRDRRARIVVRISDAKENLIEIIRIRKTARLKESGNKHTHLSTT